MITREMVTIIELSCTRTSYLPREERHQLATDGHRGAVTWDVCREHPRGLKLAQVGDASNHALSEQSSLHGTEMHMYMHGLMTATKTEL